jgi:hypothetical protein
MIKIERVTRGHDCGFAQPLGGRFRLSHASPDPLGVGHTSLDPLGTSLVVPDQRRGVLFHLTLRSRDHPRVRV